MRKSIIGVLALGGLLAVSGCGSSSSNTIIPVAVPPVMTTALWVANGANVLEFVPGQFTAGVTDPAPNLAINSAAFAAPQGVQFDGANNLWVIDGGNVAGGGAVAPALFFFSAAQLNALHTNAAPSPAVTLRSASFVFPQQAVFAGGNLWVTDNGANAVFVFSAAQLAAGGTNVTPFITLTSSTPFNGPLGLAFDPTTNNLWVANNGSTTLFEFNSANLPTTSQVVTLTPNVVLSTNAGSIEAPWGLIFDSAGDLFSSNANVPNTVVEFAHALLGTSGAPAPTVTIAPITDGGAVTLAAPNGVALDNLGDLAAISSAAPFGIPLYAAATIPTGGALTPASFLVGATTTLNAPAGCTFGPTVP